LQVSDEVYAVLRGIAGRLFRPERADHTLQPTAVVHEAVLRLMQSGGDLSDEDTLVCFAVQAMRRVLVDHARHVNAAKRGGGRTVFELRTDDASAHVTPVDLLELEEALGALARENELAAQVIELRVFGGLSISACADILSIPKHNAYALWRFGRAFLRAQLGHGEDADDGDDADGGGGDGGSAEDDGGGDGGGPAGGRNGS
jgi:RNA polymerase sigma factor (TIGR02999 family)